VEGWRGLAGGGGGRNEVRGNSIDLGQAVI
jgi:hypothetical protein